MENCITLDRMVMAPTAMSLPYSCSWVLKQMEMTLSVSCMTKGDRPRATQGQRILTAGRRLGSFRRR